MTIVDEYYEEKSLHGGWQKRYRFDNGYGASLVNHSGSYGLEMAVTKFIHEDDNKEWDIVYDTPITDDVLAHLEEGEVEYYLNRVKQLSTNGKDTDGETKSKESVGVFEMLDSFRGLM